MNTFSFRIPLTAPAEPIREMKRSTAKEWLIWWAERYDHESDDDPEYWDLIQNHKSFSAGHFRRIGKWKDNATTEGRWKPNVASVAYPIWEQVASELPTCTEESLVAAFLKEWSERAYTDIYKTVPVRKRFGLSRATTLLHFVTGGRYPIFDTRVRAAIARLLDRPEISGTLGSYMDSCLPVFRELAECCGTIDFRTLDKALFSYGAFLEKPKPMVVAGIKRRIPDAPGSTGVLVAEDGRPANSGAAPGGDKVNMATPARIECSATPLSYSGPDGLEAIELYVYREFERFVQKPIPKQPISVTVEMPTGTYEGRLRTNPSDGYVYICSDLTTVPGGHKISLAKALMENGYERKDRVEVLIEDATWRVGAKRAK